MEKICFEILNKWAEYVKYDEDQKHFNLLSWNYETHKVTKALKHIIEEYDETGLLAVLSVKRLFNTMLRDSKVKLYDILMNPEELDSHREMYNLFNSSEIVDAEKKYFNSIFELVCNVIGKKLIGEIDHDVFESKVFEYTNVVVDTLDKCKVEFYKKGGEFKEISNFSTKILVFNSLAECVLNLSNAPDGMYLCFINIYQSADSYFGFFIKNNGNLLSANERIDEAFKGQHCNARNGRWAENKADEIFPYEYIFEFGDYDYKGYSHTYKINEDKLAFFNLGEDVFLPLVLAMILLSKKLKVLDPSDYEPVYLDSLLEVNIPLLEVDKNELMVIEKNELIQYNNSLNLNFDLNAILDGSALDEFNDRSGSRGDYVSARNGGQLFVELYGKDFTFQPDVFSTQKLLSTGNYSYVPEYVGSEHRMRCMAFIDIRRQLAEYIRQKMREEFEAFGGKPAVESWFKNSINANMDSLKKLAVEHYIGVKKGEIRNTTGGWRPSDCEDRYFISLLEKERDIYSFDYFPLLIVNNHESCGKVYDLDNNTRCSIFFVFRALDYVGLENLFGEEVPKVVKGWNEDGHRTYGNSNLDLTEPVEFLGLLD